MGRATLPMLARAVAPAAIVLALAACDTNLDPPIVEVGPNAVPDFGLLDVNPASATYGQVVSPRDYVGTVSAWYFGHST
jgi:hypothetical protein